MKIIGTIGSIKKNSNKLISTTFSDWSAVREGTFIKFNDDSQFYIVSHTEKKIFLKDFILIKPNVLQINEDCGINISEGDSLNISYKEYEINAVYKLLIAGQGYKNGDHLTLGGGAASLNIADHTLNSAIVNVDKVGSKGEIIEFNLINKGKYLEAPPNITDLKGGQGSGASIEVSFKLTDHRSFIERDVQKVEFQSSSTLVYLVYGLPNGIKDGKLSIEKWEIIFNSNYNGENRSSQPFQVTRDFTPNLKIPLIAKNSQNQELTINHGFAVLDKKIAELEERIKKLEK